eukprot:TRINITY_DN276_c3_g1_i1.p1 TRINITY_DN276_c3_g1~~TRINITY_DN276_c3_g1_i1.p1  ORF type:complete len:455 (+),score=66.38 TRINITY_DN276_c3_g1_i1:38-1366(+)
MTRRASGARSFGSSSELSFYSFHSPKTRASAAESSPLRFIEVGDDEHSPTTNYSLRNSFARAAELSNTTITHQSIKDPPLSPKSPNSPIAAIDSNVTVHITNFAGHALNPLTFCYPSQADQSPHLLPGYLIVCCGSEQISKARSLTFDPAASVLHDQNGIGGCVVSPSEVLPKLVDMCNKVGVRHDLCQVSGYHSASLRGSPTHSRQSSTGRSWQRLYEDARVSKAKKDFKFQMLQEHRRQKDEDHRTVVNRRVSLQHAAYPGTERVKEEFDAAGIPFQKQAVKKRYTYLRKTGTAVDYNDAFQDSFDVSILAGNPEAEAILFDDGLTEVWPRNLLARSNKREPGDETCFDRLYTVKVPVLMPQRAAPDLTQRESRKRDFYEKLSRGATTSSLAKQHSEVDPSDLASSRSPSPPRPAEKRESTRKDFFYKLAVPRNPKESIR